MTYNGHANHATWLVSLWLDGNYSGEGTYREVRRIIQDTVATGEYSEGYALTNAVVEGIKEMVEDATTADAEGLAFDLLTSILDDVDWRELAEDLISEVREG